VTPPAAPSIPSVSPVSIAPPIIPFEEELLPPMDIDQADTESIASVESRESLESRESVEERRRVSGEKDLEGPPSLSYLGSDVVVTKAKRVSRELLESVEEIEAKRRMLEVSPVPSPELEVSVSQFEIPHREERPEVSQLRVEIGPITTIFRKVLDEKFDEKEKRSERVELVFDEVLEAIAMARTGSLPSRRDVAVSFMQLLILKTLQVIGVEQFTPYGPLLITKGLKWTLRFSSSQTYE